MANLATDQGFQNPYYVGQALASDPESLRQMRSALRNLGYYSGDLEGGWDPATAEALKNFQITFGYGNQNGNIDRDTWYGLLYSNGQVLNSKNTGQIDETVRKSLELAQQYNPALTGIQNVRTSLPAPMPTQYPDQIDPISLQNYENQRAQANTTYGNQMAQLDYLRSKYASDYGQQQNDFNYQWDQTRNKLPGSYAGRGLLNSGIYMQGLQDYANARYRGNENLNYNYQQQLGGLNTQGQQYEAQRKTTLDSLEASKAAQRQYVASQIKAIQ